MRSVIVLKYHNRTKAGHVPSSAARSYINSSSSPLVLTGQSHVPTPTSLINQSNCKRLSAIGLSSSSTTATVRMCSSSLSSSSTAAAAAATGQSSTTGVGMNVAQQHQKQQEAYENALDQYLLSNNTTLAALRKQVQQHEYTNFDSPWPTFGAVVGLTSAVALGGVYIDQQKRKKEKEQSLLIQNDNDDENQSNTTSVDDDSNSVKQQLLYRFGNTMLLSSSPTSGTATEETNVAVSTPVTEITTSAAESSTVSTAVQQDEQNDDNQNDTHSGADVVFVDAYENLPEEDEETECSMCNTFRQGPCRPYWRKFEHCIKDSDNNTDFNTNCIQYGLPFRDCISKYPNLYGLISLDQSETLIVELEKSIYPHERRCWPCTKSNPVVQMDWGTWPEFVDKIGFQFTEIITGPFGNNDDDDDGNDINTKAPIPLWKRFPEELDPIIIYANASIPRQVSDDDDNDIASTLILKCAWVTDQDGRLLGILFSDQYRALQQQSINQKDGEGNTNSDDNGNESNDDNDMKQNDDQETYSTLFNCTFSIIPGCTEQVIVHGMYSENPLTIPDSKEISDVLLYTSKPYSLSEAVKEQSTVTDPSRETETSTLVRPSTPLAASPASVDNNSSSTS